MSISRLHLRTNEGLRVALATLPSSMPVQIGEGVEVAAETVADLRVLTELPHPIEVVIPYRVETGSIVIVSRASE
jgi:hypothetical protein